MRHVDATPRIGRMKSFSRATGYGFLIDEETRREVFVHATGLVDPAMPPVSGAKVEFILASRDGKPRALGVRSLDQ